MTLLACADLGYTVPTINGEMEEPTNKTNQEDTAPMPRRNTSIELTENTDHENHDSSSQHRRLHQKCHVCRRAGMAQRSGAHAQAEVARSRLLGSFLLELGAAHDVLRRVTFWDTDQFEEL